MIPEVAYMKTVPILQKARHMLKKKVLILETSEFQWKNIEFQDWVAQTNFSCKPISKWQDRSL